MYARIRNARLRNVSRTPHSEKRLHIVAPCCVKFDQAVVFIKGRRSTRRATEGDDRVIGLLHLGVLLCVPNCILVPVSERPAVWESLRTTRRTSENCVRVLHAALDRRTIETSPADAPRHRVEVRRVHITAARLRQAVATIPRLNKSPREFRISAKTTKESRNQRDRKSPALSSSTAVRSFAIAWRNVWKWRTSTTMFFHSRLLPSG